MAEYKTARGKKGQTIQKDQCPRLLKKLLYSLEPSRESNLQAGFRKTEIFPLDRESVLNRLPRRIEAETENEYINRSVSEVFVNYLQQLRCSETEDAAPPRKKRRLDVEPGKSVQGDVGNSNLDVRVPQNVLPGPSDDDWSIDILTPQNVLLGLSEADRFIDIPVSQNILLGPSDADWLSMSTEEDLIDCESDPECKERANLFRFEGLPTFLMCVHNRALTENFVCLITVHIVKTFLLSMLCLLIFVLCGSLQCSTY